MSLYRKQLYTKNYPLTKQGIQNANQEIQKHLDEKTFQPDNLNKMCNDFNEIISEYGLSKTIFYSSRDLSGDSASSQTADSEKEIEIPSEELHYSISEQFGSIYVTVSFPGEKALNEDQLKKWDEQHAENQSFLQTSSFSKDRHYYFDPDKKQQCFTYILKKKPMHILVKVGLAIGLAVLFGWFAALLPEDVRKILVAKICSPIINKYMLLLNSIASFMIFFSVANSIIREERLEKFLKNCRDTMIGFGKSLLILGFVMMIIILPLFQTGAIERITNKFFPETSSTEKVNAPESEMSSEAQMLESVANIGEMFLDIIPNGMIDPFVEASVTLDDKMFTEPILKHENPEKTSSTLSVFHVNMLQVVALAICIGVVLLSLKTVAFLDNAKPVFFLQGIFKELESLFAKLLSILTGLIPVIIFFNLFQIIVEKKWNTLGKWIVALPLLAICVLAITIVNFAITVIKTGCSPARLFRQMWPIFTKVFSSGASSAVLGDDDCKKIMRSEEGLGLNALYDLAIPMGSVIYMPAVFGYLVIFVLCGAQFYNMETPLVFFIKLIVSAFLLSIAMPPVVGGAASGYTLIAAQMSLPSACVSIALILDPLLADRLMTTGNIVALPMTTMQIAKKQGTLVLGKEKTANK